MVPQKKLPHPPQHASEEAYVERLLDFLTTSTMLQSLCGGLHIMDFVTREPDLYQTIIPRDWRDWLQTVKISDLLDLLMREDVNKLLSRCRTDSEPSDCAPRTQSRPEEQIDGGFGWRGYALPPLTLLKYIRSIHHLSLDRTFHRTALSKPKEMKSLSRQIIVGMKPKKAHEVENFAAFIDDLTADIAQSTRYNITHLVDFGSGQNYLGRALASPLYQKRVVAVESKQTNITGAMGMDVSAKITEKKLVMRNKKAFRAGEFYVDDGKPVDDARSNTDPSRSTTFPRPSTSPPLKATEGGPPTSLGLGHIQYVEHVIVDGDLSHVATQLQKTSGTEPIENGRERAPIDSGKEGGGESAEKSSSDLQLMVISLHSCGNLLHHGLRSLVLNPSVKAVAMIGCCYNLVTDRLGPRTYKSPTLRSLHPRLEETSSAFDPHGFPMSDHFATYEHPDGRNSSHGPGVRLNITARMMAVQAPQNWSQHDSDAFFTRHFYRALLQRIFLDRGIVKAPKATDDFLGGSPRGWSGDGKAITIGSLGKAFHASFPAYVRGAVAKLDDGSEWGSFICRCMAGLTDEEIGRYEERYGAKKHELCAVWSLMAVSAGVVESAIVVDRWLYLKEQKSIQACWVEAAFSYKQSPRNLVVVGIKK